MRTFSLILLITCWLNNVFAQDNYENTAKSIILDSVTFYAVGEGFLKPSDFIRFTMDDTTLFHAFSLLKVSPYSMQMNAFVQDKKNKKGHVKRNYTQHIEEKCRFQEYQTLDSSGYFYDKKGKPISETYQMMMQFFTTPKKVCNIKLSPAPKGIITLSQPKDNRQQKELIKRLIFAPHTLRIEVPFMGNKMKTNIFEAPTSDYYHFNVDFDIVGDTLSVYNFTIEVDSIKYPNWRKNVLIKKMHTTFRVEDMAIIARSYELFYPGWLASCDLSIDIKMQDVANKLYPKTIHYQGDWKFPTKGKDHSNIYLQFNQISTTECTH